MKVCGIDPGKSGGLSICDDGNITHLIPMPTYEAENGKDMVDFVSVGRFLKKENPQVVYIERVGAMPGNGGVSMFGFGFSTGGLHGVCGALEIPVKLIGPRMWQKFLMGDETHDKQDTIDFVQKNWPSVNLLATKRSKKPHDGMADAAAIGYYGFKNSQIVINKEDI